MTALVEIDRVTVAYLNEARPAVDDASLSLRSGEIVGLVGESGSGKSTLAFSVLGLLPPTANILSGEIRVSGRALKRGERSGAAYIPQEPLSAFNPTIKVGRQIDLVLRRHTRADAKGRRGDLERMLARMGIETPERVANAYPFELSGGQVQRALLAQAFLLRPSLVVADEPTTALDVTVQAQVLILLESLARDTGAGVLFISHNLGLVRRLCDRVAVMRDGQIVETGDTEEVVGSPNHPYTRQLLGALPERSNPRTMLPVQAAQP